MLSAHPGPGEEPGTQDEIGESGVPEGGGNMKEVYRLYYQAEYIDISI